MTKLKYILLSGCAVLFLSHCQQPVGNGDPVTIPSVQVTCRSSNCSSANGSSRIFIYITTSSCRSITYGQVATGVGNVSCAGGSCTGNSFTWSNPSGARITQIASNSYAFCALIDLAGSYSGSVVAADATSGNPSVFVGSPTEPVSNISLSNWIDGDFVN